MASIGFTIIARREFRKQFGRHMLIRDTVSLSNGHILKRCWLIRPMKETAHAHHRPTA